jgi:hypothetical protein
VEIISRRCIAPPTGAAGMELESAIAATLRRRPSTVEDLSSAIGQPINDVTAVLSRLVKSKKAGTKTFNNRIFYRMVC